jgi:clan AA aspartic protease (TIGR02281 family)
MTRMHHLLALLLVTAATLPVQAEDSFGPTFPHQVGLSPTGSGSFTVTAALAGIEDEFLLDTGASMVTISRQLFDRLDAGSTTRLHQVAARMASGKLQTLDVYRIKELTLGNCTLGPVDVAVLKRGGRNLLGMSALSMAAPFAVYTSPPALGLSNCGATPSLAATD